MFTLEPFGLTVPEIRRLTDWQLVNLYYRPARKAARDRERRGGAGRAGRGGTPPAVAGKGAFVAEMMGMFGGTPERWGAEYDLLEESADPR